MNVRIMSSVDIYNGRELIGLDENTAVISFYQEKYGRQECLTQTDARVLFVCSDHIGFRDEKPRIEHADFFPITQKIAKFVLSAAADGCDIICQCEYGKTVSAGCAAAILEYFCGDGVGVFANPIFSPNRMAFQKIYAALCCVGADAGDEIMSAVRSHHNRETALHQLYSDIVDDYNRNKDASSFDHGSINVYSIITNDHIMHNIYAHTPKCKSELIGNFLDRYKQDDIRYICISRWHKNNAAANYFDRDSETGRLYSEFKYGLIEYDRTICKKYMVLKCADYGSGYSKEQ